MAFIIGDIAGEYDTLLALVNRATKWCHENGEVLGEIISVGDMVDRGLKSKEVLYFFKDSPNTKVIMGNHEHLMLDCLFNKKYYQPGIWVYNGGGSTIKSFYPDLSLQDGVKEIANNHIELLKWIEQLPLHLELDGKSESDAKAFISHAIKNPVLSIERVSTLGSRESDKYCHDSLIWNRGGPRRMEGYYQMCGHNSHWGLKYFSDKEGEYGICLDSSRERILTGMHWPSKAIIQHEYV